MHVSFSSLLFFSLSLHSCLDRNNSISTIVCVRFVTKSLEKDRLYINGGGGGISPGTFSFIGFASLK